MLAQNELSHKTPVKDQQALKRNAEVTAKHNCISSLRTKKFLIKYSKSKLYMHIVTTVKNNVTVTGSGQSSF